MPESPLILLVETSAEFCSVGLARGAELQVLHESGARFDHSKNLAPAIEHVLEQGSITASDLDAIAVSAGPGSYTGLRVGISTAKAMCFALNIPLLAVDTLYALAFEAKQRIPQASRLFPNIDARRMEVYISEYDQELEQLRQNTAIIVDRDTFSSYRDSTEKVVFCGSGTSKCLELLEDSGIELLPLQCSAAFLAGPAADAFERGRHADLIEFKPEYVKAPNITAPAVVLRDIAR